MAVIFMTEKRIQYYDSMSGSGSTCLKVLLRCVDGSGGIGSRSPELTTDAVFLDRYLHDEMEHKKSAKFDADGWELVTTEDGTPQQANGSDCGVFSCMFADYISRNKVRRAVNFLLGCIRSACRRAPNSAVLACCCTAVLSRSRSRKTTWSSTGIAWCCASCRARCRWKRTCEEPTNLLSFTPAASRLPTRTVRERTSYFHTQHAHSRIISCGVIVYAGWQSPAQ